jgi:hypothetical protein
VTGKFPESYEYLNRKTPSALSYILSVWAGDSTASIQNQSAIEVFICQQS